MQHNRRNFIKKSTLALAGAGGAFIFPMELLATLRKRVGPNDTINVGLIGCKGMGFTDLTSMLKISETNVVALCDVDESVLRERTADLEKAGIKKPKWYTDYRKLLENKDIDVVIRPEDIEITTPDKGMLTGKVNSVIFKGVHYEMEVNTGDFTWTVHSTLKKEIGEKVGLMIVADNIHIMRKES